MSDLERVIKIVFQGDDQTQRSFKLVESRLNSLTGSVQKAAAPVAELGRNLVKVELALVSMAVGGLAYATKKAVDFDSQFREISTLVDDTGQSVSDFKDEILQYSLTSGKSIEDINGALYSAISAGVDYKQSIGALAVAEKLSIAGKADLKDSLVSIASTMNAYGASTEDAAKYADILFTTVKLGQTTLPELNQSLSQVTNIAAAAGVGFDEVAAAVAALTATGAPTSEAITYIKGAITAILKPTKEAAKAAKELGLDFNATALKSKGLTAILDEVAVATGGNTEKMALLFGNVRGLNAALTLTGQGADKFKAALDAMSQSSGAVNTAYGKMADDIKIKSQTLWNTVQANLISIGDEMISSFDGVPEAAADLFRGLFDAINAGALDEVFNAIDSFADDVLKTLLDLAEFAPEALANLDFSGLINSFNDLGGEVGESISAIFGGDIDLTTAAGLEKALQGMVDLFRNLTYFTSGFLEGVRPALKIIGELGEAASDTGGKTAKMLGAFTGLAQTAELAAGGLNKIGNALLAIVSVSGAKGAISLLANSFDKLTMAGIDLVGAAGKGGLLGVAAAGGYLTGFLINKYIPGVSTAAEATWGLVDSLVDFTGKNEAAENASNSLSNAVETYINNMGKYNYDLSIFKDELESIGIAVDNLPDEAVLRLAVDNDLVTPEKLLSLTAELREQVASAEPILLPLDVDNELVVKNFDDLLGVIGEKATEDPPVITPEVLPPEDLLEDVAAIMEPVSDMFESYFETIQNAVEWEAKIEISEIEANAEIVKSIMESVGDSAESAGNVLASLFGSVGDLTDAGIHRWDIQDWVDDQIEIQQKSLELQEKMTDAQIRYMDARTRAFENGDPLITVNGDGLQDHLEGFMWEIFKTVQTRISEEGLDMLLTP